MANRPYCRIKRLPPELWAKAAADAVQLNPENDRGPVPEGAGTEFLIQNTAKFWPKYSQLTVGFLDGASEELQARVLAHMREWSKYARITFKKAPPDSADVRISFDQRDGFWSLIGTDIRHVAAPEATMNLALTDDDSEERLREYVRHETGHTIGFEHEHSRRSIVNRFDPEKTYAYFAEPPDSWSRETTDQNVLTPIDDSLLMNFPNTVTDVRSIMCYDFPAKIMKDGIAIPGGFDIDGFDALAAIRLCGDTYTILLEGQLSDNTPVSQTADGTLHDPKFEQEILNFRVNLWPGDNYMSLQYRLGGDQPWLSPGQWTGATSLRNSVAFQLTGFVTQYFNIAYAIQDFEGRLATGMNGSLAELPFDSEGISNLWVSISQTSYATGIGS